MRGRNNCQEKFLGLETATTIISICCTGYNYTLNLRSRGTAVVVDTSSGGVVGEAVVVVVDLVGSLLQDTDHGVERTETILVNRAARVGVGNRDDSIVDEETNLLGDVSGRAGHDLSGEVGGEGNDLASNERVGALVAGSAESGTLEQGGEVEGSQGVENNDFVGGIGVDGLVQREVGRRVVVSLVKS